MKFDTFKKNLQPYVGVPTDCFEIYYAFDNDDVSQRQCVLTSLACFEDGQRFQIKLGSGLRSGEIVGRLYHLFINSSEVRIQNYKHLVSRMLNVFRIFFSNYFEFFSSLINIYASGSFQRT